MRLPDLLTSARSNSHASARLRVVILLGMFVCDVRYIFCFFFFLNDPAPPEISPLPLPDALPIGHRPGPPQARGGPPQGPRHPLGGRGPGRSEEHTSELQSLRHLVCRLLLEN